MPREADWKNSQQKFERMSVKTTIKLFGLAQVFVRLKAEAGLRGGARCRGRTCRGIRATSGAPRTAIRSPRSDCWPQEDAAVLGSTTGLILGAEDESGIRR